MGVTRQAGERITKNDPKKHYTALGIESQIVFHYFMITPLKGDILMYLILYVI